jgi:UDP-glucose 4-epimerase
MAYDERMEGLILVTGGAGFIGSHLVDALLAAGYDVRVLDDFSTGKRENLRGAQALAAAHPGRFQVIAGDVRHQRTMGDAVDGCAAVCHLVAVASVSQSLADPVGADSVTHGGTVNAVRMAVGAGVPRFVLASSCAVYGDAAQLPVAETAAPRPLSPYAEAKLAAEETCAAAVGAGQIAAVCLRFFNVYGPRQDPSSEYSGVISRFMAAAAADEPLTVYGDGQQTRDFVYVGDVVRAVVRAIQVPRSVGRPRVVEGPRAPEGPVSGVSVLNVGSGTPTSVLDVLGCLEELVGGPIERRFEAARPGDIRESRADAGRAKRVLGWEAEECFAGGLEKTWAWYRQRATW